MKQSFVEVSAQYGLALRLMQELWLLSVQEQALVLHFELESI